MTVNTPEYYSLPAYVVSVAAMPQQVPSTSGTTGEAAQPGSDSEDEVEASFKAAAERLRLQRQEEQMPIEDRLNM